MASEHLGRKATRASVIRDGAGRNSENSGGNEAAQDEISTKQIACVENRQAPDEK